MSAAVDNPDQGSSFGNISLGGKPSVSTGTLKMNDTGLAWKARTGELTRIVGSDVSNATWTRIGVPFQLKLEGKNGVVYKFDGFRETDYDSVKKFVTVRYQVPWTEAEVSSSGRNWGSAEVQGKILKFQVDKLTSFEIPLSDATAANFSKQEVVIGFNPSDTTVDDADALAQIKFFVPNTRDDEPATTTNENGEDVIPDFDEDLMVPPAEALANKILDNIEVLPVDALPLVSFERLSMSTPRGQVDFQIHSSFIFLAGKNYKIDYTQVVRIFLLPQVGINKPYSFVLSLNPPIRHGSTNYPLIVFQLPTDEVEIPLNQEGAKDNPKAAALGESMKGPLHEIISRVVGTLVDKKVTVPGANGFKSVRGNPALPCKYKQGDGFLYPLENSFICVASKNPIHIPFTDISMVIFESVSHEVSISVRLRAGNVSHNFELIPGTEHEVLYAFCKSKNIKVEGSEPKKEEPEPEDLAESNRPRRAAAAAARAGARTEILATKGKHNEEEDEEDDDFGEEDAEEASSDDEMSEDAKADNSDIRKKKRERENDGDDDEDGDDDGNDGKEPPKKKQKTKEEEEDDD